VASSPDPVARIVAELARLAVAPGAALYAGLGGPVRPWPGRVRHPVPGLGGVDAAVEPRDALAELAVGPGSRGYVVHRVLAVGDEPAVDVEAPSAAAGAGLLQLGPVDPRVGHGVASWWCR